MSPPRQSHRRDFLSGRSVQQRLADAATEVPQARPTDGERPARHAPKSYVVEVARRAMACDFAVLLNAGQYAQGQETALAALDLVDDLETQLSAYRETSEIMQVNRRASVEPVEVDGRLYDLLKLCLELYHRTDGAFDVTSAPLSKVWGFFRRQGSIPEDAALAAALAHVGSNHILLNEEDRSVAFGHRELDVDFGGIGKGYALDLGAELLVAAGVSNFLMHGGRSSVIALGQRASESGWSVGIRDPLRAGKRLGQVMLHDAALSTSGAGSQFFRHGGRRYGHILDPRSGHPAEDLLSTTVISPSAAEADALSTAFYVLGLEGAKKYCEQNPHVAAILVTPGGDVGGMTLWTLGQAASWFTPDPDAPPPREITQKNE